MDPTVAQQLNQSRDALILQYNVAASTLRKTAEMAEHYAHLLANIDYEDEPREQVGSFMKALNTKAPATIAAIEAAAATTAEDAKGKRKRTPKDPEAPKKPATAYLVYQNEVRQGMKEKYPDLSNKDLLGKISEDWKVMNEETRKPFVEKADKSKLKYEQDMKDYGTAHPDRVKAKAPPKKEKAEKVEKEKPAKAAAATKTTKATVKSAVLQPKNSDAKAKTSKHASSPDDESGSEEESEEESEEGSEVEESDSDSAPPKKKAKASPPPKTSASKRKAEDTKKPVSNKKERK